MSAAQSYFESHLHIGSSTIVASRTGDECAVVSLRAPDGHREGVAVVLQGQPTQWQAVGMSPALRPSGYRDDGDVQCGLANIAQHAADHGLGKIRGAFRTVGGPVPGRSENLIGQIDVHAGSVHGPVTAVATATDGAFRIDVPAGRYWLVGHSPQVHINGRERCAAPRPVEVRGAHASIDNVFCQIK